jgi:endonuclease IV
MNTIALKNKKLKKVFNNISEDFKFSNDVGEYALLFYKIDTAGHIEEDDLPKVKEYVTTGLENQPSQAEVDEYLQSNPNVPREQVENNIQAIKEEYEYLLEFIESKEK